MNKQQLKDEFELLSKPGDTILETMEHYGLTHEQTAYQMGISEKDLRAIIAAELEITPEFADKLQKVLLIDAEFWINSMTRYREKLAILNDEWLRQNKKNKKNKI